MNLPRLGRSCLVAPTARREPRARSAAPPATMSLTAPTANDVLCGLGGPRPARRPGRVVSAATVTTGPTAATAMTRCSAAMAPISCWRGGRRGASSCAAGAGWTTVESLPTVRSGRLDGSRSATTPTAADKDYDHTVADDGTCAYVDSCDDAGTSSCDDDPWQVPERDVMSTPTSRSPAAVEATTSSSVPTTTRSSGGGGGGDFVASRGGTNLVDGSDGDDCVYAWRRAHEKVLLRLRVRPAIAPTSTTTWSSAASRSCRARWSCGGGALGVRAVHSASSNVSGSSSTRCAPSARTSPATAPRRAARRGRAIAACSASTSARMRGKLVLVADLERGHERADLPRQALELARDPRFRPEAAMIVDWYARSASPACVPRVAGGRRARRASAALELRLREAVLEHQLLRARASRARRAARRPRARRARWTSGTTRAAVRDQPRSGRRARAAQRSRIGPARDAELLRRAGSPSGARPGASRPSRIASRSASTADVDVGRRRSGVGARAAHTMLRSGRRSAFWKRSTPSGAMSANVGRPRTRSRSSSPVARALQEAVAGEAGRVEEAADARAGLADDRVVVRAHVVQAGPAAADAGRCAIRGARRWAMSSSAGIQSSVVSMLKLPGCSSGSDMPISRPGPSRW